MDWSKYSFVVRAKNRKSILLHLSDPKTPSQLSEELKLSLSHVSRAVKELEEKELIECLTPNEKVGRVYRRTPDGEKIANHLSKSPQIN